MARSVQRPRRWLGLLCLAAALLLLLLGQTLLKPALRGFAYLLYWLTCFILTLAALLLAARDLRSLQRQARAEQRDLIEQTLATLPKRKAGHTPPRPTTTEEDQTKTE